MSNITLIFNHNKSVQEIKDKIQQQLNPLINQFGIKLKWNNYDCDISGLINGSININKNSIIIKIKIGFTMGFLKTRIEKKIKEKIKYVLK